MVATCSGNPSDGVFTFSRSDANANPVQLGVSVGCTYGISFDVGNNGKLWVASKSQGKVYRFTGTTADFSGVTVSDAYGLAVDTAGNAWVTSCSGNSLQQINSTGSPVGSALALPDSVCPGGLAFDKQGSLWVLSEGSQDNGTLVQVTGGNGVVQLSSLTQVTFGGVAFNPGAAGLPTHQ